MGKDHREPSRTTEALRDSAAARHKFNKIQCHRCLERRLQVAERVWGAREAGNSTRVQDLLLNTLQQ